MTLSQSCWKETWRHFWRYLWVFMQTWGCHFKFFQEAGHRASKFGGSNGSGEQMTFMKDGSEASCPPLVSRWRLLEQENHRSHREKPTDVFLWVYTLYTLIYLTHSESEAWTLYHFSCVWSDIDTVTVIKNSEQLTEQIDAKCFHEKPKLRETLLMIPYWFYPTHCLFKNPFACSYYILFEWLCKANTSKPASHSCLVTFY